MRRHFEVNNRSMCRISTRTTNCSFFSGEGIESSGSMLEGGVGESSETYDEYRL